MTGEIIKDIVTLQRKVNYLMQNNPDLCSEVYLKLEEIINLIKKDRRIYGYS